MAAGSPKVICRQQPFAELQKAAKKDVKKLNEILCSLQTSQNVSNQKHTKKLQNLCFHQLPTSLIVQDLSFVVHGFLAQPNSHI